MPGMMGNPQYQNAGELRQLADQQAALRRVATIVARGARSTAIFAAVAEEVGELFGADASAIIRFEPDDQATLVGTRGQTRRETGTRFTPDPALAIASVRATGRAARIDANGPAQASVPDVLGTPGIRSVVDVPIVLEGRVWGAIGVAARRGPLPPDTEQRLTDFAELIATAIGNAQAHDELTASRARIVTTADQTRRRIERDLHDGTQQQLVTLRLQLKAVQASVPPELDELAADLDHLATGLSDALDQLREIARGIHPAILAEGGLGPALKALGRSSPVPVDLTVRVERQLSQPVEVGAYYVVSEALTNAAKHARASAITVTVEDSSDVLRVLVHDDGIGGGDFTRGTGLQGLKDRVEALSGRFSLDSPRGAGTTLQADFPLANAPAYPTGLQLHIRVPAQAPAKYRTGPNGLDADRFCPMIRGVTGTEALRQARELSPDVALVDISLGTESGFDVAREISPYVRSVILISSDDHYEENDYAELIAGNSAVGFLSKAALSADAIGRLVP